MGTGSKYSEVDAMGEVDAALAKIAPEAQQRVIDWAVAKYQLKQGGPPISAGTPQLAHHDPQPGKDIKTFLAQKRPDGFYERIACLVYHLEKFQGKTEVGRQDIIQANSDARLSKMSNPSVFVKHATHTYGYLTSLGKRKFALSARGEAVVEGLPDRAGVDQALADHPHKKSKKKRSKK